MNIALAHQPQLKTVIQFAIADCSLGKLLVAQTHKGICSVMLGDNEQTLIRDLQQQFNHAQLTQSQQALQPILKDVLQLIETPSSTFIPPLDIQGTAFQQSVWRALRQIPAGKTVSYTELAANIGKPKAVRAVASACAANKLAIIIPCHRVIRSDGNLSGYRWGVEFKRRLLELEKTAVMPT